MGNDIFSAFLDKKKNMILDYANTFFKYTVNDKNKINKTLSNIIDIYIDSFYLNKDGNFSDVDKHFALQKSKDILLKEVIASTIKFYQINNLGQNLEKDKGTIILISNVIYLGISLGDKCFKNNSGEASTIVEQFLNKYRMKIRVKQVEYVDELRDSLISISKKHMNSIKKAFKLLEGTNYSINIKKILESDNQYLVESDYDIKLLSKYSQKEIDGAIDKSIMAEHALISLEQTVLKIVYDFLGGNYDNQYFVKLPIELFEKQKYIKLLDEIFKVSRIKNNIIILFDYSDITNSLETIENLKNNQFYLSVHNINSLKIKQDSFDNIDFAFVNQQFLEMYDGYQEIWSAKGIKFIIS